jgi:hypothetical protein
MKNKDTKFIEALRGVVKEYDISYNAFFEAAGIERYKGYGSNIGCGAAVIHKEDYDKLCKKYPEMTKFPPSVYSTREPKMKKEDNVNNKANLEMFVGRLKGEYYSSCGKAKLGIKNLSEKDKQLALLAIEAHFSKTEAVVPKSDNTSIKKGKNKDRLVFYSQSLLKMQRSEEIANAILGLLYGALDNGLTLEDLVKVVDVR